MIEAPESPPLRLRVMAVNHGATDAGDPVKFYVGAANALELARICESETIELQDAEVPTYTGIQRPLSTKRIKEIRDYLLTVRPVIPNAVIISIDSQYIEAWIDVDPAREIHEVLVKRDTRAGHIIDGQHRLRGMEVAGFNHDVAFTLFIDLNIEDRADMFARINSTQRPVNPSIAYQLFGYSRVRSPQKVAHALAYALNTEGHSPFYRKLKLLGTRDAWNEKSPDGGALSQATFAREFLTLVTGNARRDQNAYLRGAKPLPDSSYPLRDDLIKERDRHIMEVYWKFWSAVADTWKEQWENETGQFILSRTVGYVAWTGVLKHWLLGPLRGEVYSDFAKGSTRIRGIRESFTSDAAFTSKNYRTNYAVAGELRDALIDELDLPPILVTR